MKKNIFAFIIAASLGFMSCEDFIEHEKRGVQDLDNYFKTDTECRDFVIDLYKRALLNNDWQPIAHTRITNETATDDAWMGNTGQSADGFSPASEYLITPNRMGYLTDLFKERYKNIMACNIAINSIPEAPISEDKKKSYVGEALFCRAYNYLDLVGNFGGVPLVLKMLSSNDMNLGRSSKEEIYQQIENDLKSAVHMVNTTYGSEGKGRATVWTCTALLARVSLYQEKWKEAYHYADTTIMNSGCKLEPDFLDIWNVNNHNGIESLIEVQTSPEVGKILGNPLSTLCGGRGESLGNFPSKDPNDIMDGWGWGVPTSDLENCYLSEEDEIRRRSTITVCGDAVYGDEDLNPTYVFDLAQNKSGRVIRKYYIPIATRRTLEDKRYNAPLNTPIIRLAEMYLTRAEAAFHLGMFDEAMDDVDIIRARVKLSPKKGTVTGNEILYAIWKERRMELAFEGLRLFDIRRQIDPATNQPVIAGLFGPNGSFVRYNMYESTDQYETSNLKELQNKGINFDINKHLVWPIPQSEIDRSFGTVTQNPNY